MPASRILFFARTRRWPIVAGATRNAEAMVAASKPSTVCRISGARMPARSPDARRRTSARGARRECRMRSPRPLRAPRRSAADARLRRRRCAAGGRVDRLAARDREQPRFGLCGMPLRGPVGERGREGVGRARPPPPRRRACAPQDRRRACRSCGARPPRRHRARRSPLDALHRPDRPHFDRADRCARGSAPPRTSAASRSGTSIR